MRLVGRPRRAAQLLRTCNIYGHDTAQAFHLALLQTEGLIASIFGVLSVLLSSPAGAPLAPLNHYRLKPVGCIATESRSCG
jgi:hypothetical protein